MNNIVVATLCYIIKDEKILMLHRNKKEGDAFKDYWNGLGGKLEINESPEECVQREVFEETGLQITNPILRGINTFPNNRGLGKTWIVFIYEVNQFEGQIAECNEGTLEWISLDALKTLHLQEADLIFLEWLKQKKFFSARFEYLEESLISQQVNFF